MSTNLKSGLQALDFNINFTAKKFWNSQLADLEFKQYLLAGNENAEAGQLKNTAIPASYALSFPDSSLSALSKVAASNEAKHIVLLSILGMLIQKYDSCDTVVIFTPLYRSKSPSQQYASVLPVRMEDLQNRSIISAINEVKTKVVEAFRHASFPLEQILRVSSRDALAEVPVVGFVLEPVQEETAFHSLEVDLLFHISVAEDLRLRIQYNSNKYAKDNVERIARLFVDFVSEVLANPENLVRNTELISSHERDLILNQFNDTAQEFPENKTLIDLFKERAELHPDQLAICFGPDSLSYRDLDRLSNQVAHYLIKKIPYPGSVIGVELDRSLEMMIAIFGILKAGFVYLPIAPEYPLERKKYIIKDSHAKGIFTGGTGLEAAFSAITELDVRAAKSFSQAPIQLSKPGQQAYIIYTSGSTGKPKGVIIRHHSIVNRLNWMQKQYLLNSDDRLLQKTPIAFDVSVWELFWWSMYGASLILAPPDAEKDPAQLCALIEQERISVIHFVPSMLNGFLSYLNSENAEHDLSSIRHLFTSGEALKSADAQGALELCRNARLHNLYGPTEATIDVSAFEVVRHQSYDRIPIGKPIDNTTLLIVNAAMQLQPIGIPGELLIGGVNLAIGYQNRPNLTKERFVENPFGKGKRYYKTGDLARWLPDGNIDFLGRMDKQVKIRGYRIELGEIELAIGSDPGVQQTVVLAKEIQGVLQLRAYVQVTETYEEAHLYHSLRSKLPDYMIPAHFIVLDQLPLTINGKLDHKALLAMQPNAIKSFTAPATTLEAQLLRLWKEVLEVEQLSIHDPFFRSGGDSILAVRLVAKLNKTCHTALSLPDLYTHDTVSKLAVFMEEKDLLASQLIGEEIHAYLHDFSTNYLSGNKDDRIAAVYPMSDIEKGMCFVHQSKPEEVLFFEQIMETVHFPKLDVQVLKNALKILVNKHEIFRTRFDFPALAHVVFKEVTADIDFRDLSSLSAKRQRKTIYQYLEESRRQHIDLKADRLWRITLFKLKENHHELLFEYHHAMLDGWSFASFLTELNNTYLQLLEDPNLKVETLSSGYRDYISLELQGKSQQQTRDFWKQYLADAERLSLVTQATEKNFYSVRHQYQEDFTAALDQLVDIYQLPKKIILLAAYMYSMRLLSGQHDVLVGLVTFNRPLTNDGDKILGCFLNEVPFRLNIPQQISWRDFLNLVNQQFLEIKRYDHLSLFEINQAVGTKMSNQNPFFDTSFNFVDWHIANEMIQEDPQGVLKADRFEFDNFLRSNISFVANYNVNADRVLCMHEYATPFMTPTTFAIYQEIFQLILTSMLESPSESIIDYDTFWKSRMQHYSLADFAAFETTDDSQFPLSFEQQNLLTAIQQTNYPEEWLQVTIDFDGDLNEDKLRDCLQQVHDKYQILNTRILKDKECFMQFCQAQKHIVLNWVEVDFYDESRKRIKWMPFNPNALLFHHMICPLSEDVNQLCVSMHPLIADDFSIRMLAAEIIGLYHRFLDGFTIQLPTSLPYIQFANWQHQLFQHTAPYFYAKWNEQHNQLLELAQQSVEENQNASIGAAMQWHQFALSRSLWDSVQGFCSERGLRPDMFFLAALRLLLHKLWPEREIPLHVDNLDRGQGALAGIFGPVQNAVWLTAPFDAVEGVKEYVQAITAHVLESQQSCLLPSSAKFDHGHLKKHTKTSPFQAFFQYLPSNSLSDAISNLVPNKIKFQWPEHSVYDINMYLEVEGDVITGALGVDTSLDCISAKTTVQRFVQLLKALIQDISSLEAIDILLDRERSLLLGTFNDTAHPYSSEATLVSLFAKQAVARGAAPALWMGDAAMSYGELDRRSNQIAHYLSEERGVKRGDLVGVMLERELDLLPVIFGILKAGAAYVPIDPAYPAARIGMIVEDSGVDLIISRSAFYADVELSVQWLEMDELVKGLSTQSAEALSVGLRSQDLAYVIFTSGSTGRPKGVMIEHGSVVNRLEWMQRQYPLSTSDVLLQKTPIVFDVSVWELFWWSLCGAQLSLLGPGEEKDPAAISAAIGRYGVSTIHFVPSMLSGFLSHLEGVGTGEELRSLSQVFCSGEALKPWQVDKFGSLLHQYHRSQLINLYGPTEATVDVSYYGCEFTGKTDLVPIGRPIQNTQLYIVGKDGQLLPPGVTGELCIGGVGLARGYINNEALTAERFEQLSSLGGQRIYHTGDLAYWQEDGNIVYQGRMDHQVKIRGYRIELGEIERQLQQYTAIQETVVMVKDQGGEPQLVAYYVAAQPVSTRRLRTHLSTTLPTYMLPTYFVHLSAIPLTRNGKINRQALPAPSLPQEENFCPPTNEVEHQLVELWAEVLRLSTDQISIESSFFEIGGHSLFAITLINKINKSFNTSFPLHYLFNNPTIKLMATKIRLQQLAARSQEADTETYKVVI